LILDWLYEEAPEELASFVKSVDARDTRIGEVDPRWEKILDAITNSNHIYPDSEEQLDHFFDILFAVRLMIVDGSIDMKYASKVIEKGNKYKSQKEETFAKRREEAFYLEGILYGEFYPEWRDDVTPENPLFVMRENVGVKIMTNTDFCLILGIDNPVFIHPNRFVGASKDTSPEVVVSLLGVEKTIKVQYLKGFKILLDRQNHMGVHNSYVEMSEDGYENYYSLEFPKEGGFRMIPDEGNSQFSPVGFDWR
jgi:hypothetical protein